MVPHAGQAVEYGGFRFEVLEMDGRRIARVLVTRLDAPKPSEAE
jgi:CBS domain containing-hemolysin-like protein